MWCYSGLRQRNFYKRYCKVTTLNWIVTDGRLILKLRLLKKIIFIVVNNKNYSYRKCLTLFTFIYLIAHSIVFWHLSYFFLCLYFFLPRSLFLIHFLFMNYLRLLLRMLTRIILEINKLAFLRCPYFTKAQWKIG